ARSGSGWVLDGSPATAAAADALDTLVSTLAGLRAVDAFRPGDRQALGLQPPAAIITLRTRRGDQRLRLGALNAAGSALDAERDGPPRVFLAGTGLLTAVERVFYQQELGGRGGVPRPETSAPGESASGGARTQRRDALFGSRRAALAQHVVQDLRAHAVERRRARRDAIVDPDQVQPVARPDRPDPRADRRVLEAGGEPGAEPAVEICRGDRPEVRADQRGVPARRRVGGTDVVTA